MTPLKLTLYGFTGIREGLGHDELSLDLESTCGDAQLVALVAPNGSGKSTILDNLHPYRLMPSRAGGYSPEQFSYYDHVCLAESSKTLEWSHQGRRFRSQLVFRIAGVRKTEAYLHEHVNGCWVPAQLSDGTISDGKTTTYDRCVHALLGNPETFFTSVFAAQNKRPLSAYKTAEVKGLLIELLQLDRIRDRSEQAAHVVSRLKQALDERRRRLVVLDQVVGTEPQLQQSLQSRRAEADSLEQTIELSMADLRRDQAHLLAIEHEYALSTENDQKRLMFMGRLDDLGRSRSLARAHYQDTVQRLAQSRKRTMEQFERSLQATQARRAMRVRSLEQTEHLIARRDEIATATRRLAAVQGGLVQHQDRLLALKRAHTERCDHVRRRDVIVTTTAHLQREAGQAALRIQRLRERLGLIAEVPCAGSDFQGQCKLLADAHEAKTLQPSADVELARVQRELAGLAEERARIDAALTASEAVDQALLICENELAAARDEIQTLGATVALQGQIDQADEKRAQLLLEIETIDNELVELEIGKNEALQNLTEEEQRAQRQLRSEMERIERDLERTRSDIDRLHPTFDLPRLVRARDIVSAGQQKIAELQRSYHAILRQLAEIEGKLEGLQPRKTEHDSTRTEIDRLEFELGWWNLLAKALSADGVIALCIDDAGPALAGLTNDLLLRCYGPRFTVSITTQTETAKKDLREGFDILVHDGDSDKQRSLSLMSGGEKVWINDCLTRAIAIHLTRCSGRVYETLFSDEADGPLDPERKRQYMRMKTQVLQIGGYTREIFISQTPELWSLADKVIDVSTLGCKVAV